MVRLSVLLCNAKFARFKDSHIIHCVGGNGGNGCSSFLRDKMTSRGPPNGANGGPGGSVYAVTTPRKSDLSHLKRVVTAGHGKHGQGSYLTGVAGTDEIIELPVGTRITELVNEEDKLDDIDDLIQWNQYPSHRVRPQDETFDDERIAKSHVMEHIRRRRQHLLQVDLDYLNSKPELLAEGGMGGLGNINFVTLNNRTPTLSISGLKGIKRIYKLELKTISDVGLVGFPNAGKSSFLRALSRARPQVANWAFTTLTPHVGTVNASEFKDLQFKIADLPGLVEGASAGRGLGHEFLRHVEKTSILAFVLDLSAENCFSQYEILLHEIKNFNEDILLKPKIVLANKADLPNTEEKFKELESNIHNLTPNTKVLPISALEGLGMREIIHHLASMVVEELQKKDIELEMLKKESVSPKIIEG